MLPRLRLSPLLLPLFAVLAAGCKDPAADMPDLGEVIPPFSGGKIRVESCGYDVVTPDGVSNPVPGQPKLGSDPTPMHVHLGFASDPSRSMVVTWRSRDGETLASTIQYGTGGKTDKTLEGITFHYENINNQPDIRLHEAHLCGLTPDTEYSYRVGGKDEGGREAWSPVYTFRTAPDRGRADAQVTALFVGDTRNGPEVWGKLLKQAVMAKRPDVIFFSGDAVFLGQIQADWDAWFEQAKDVLPTVPIVMANGNHELNAPHYYAQFAMPGNEEYFSFDYGPVHLTVLNDTPRSLPDITGVQATFLDADLKAAAKAPFRLVMHHKPIYSASDTHGGEESLLEAWAPIYDAHGLDMVLNGHVHGYERSKPMRANKPVAEPKDGTIYVVSGGGGAPLYSAGIGAWTEKSESTYNFSVLDVRAGRLALTAHKDDGTQLDSLTIMKPPPGM